MNDRTISSGFWGESALHPCQVRCPNLPLAVYREVAAHLCQLPGVEVGFLPQTAPQFDYSQSQVGGLSICYGQAAGAMVPAQVEQILAYYGDRYGAWEIIRP